jgi:hypothetical protein
MAANAEIQKWVSEHHGFTPSASWIAHCRQLWLHTRKTRRLDWSQGRPRVRNARPNSQQCPVDRQPAIRAAFEHFGFLNKNLSSE